MAHYDLPMVCGFGACGWATLFLSFPRSALIVKQQVRHFPAGIAGIQTIGKYLSSPSMALDTRFPAGMTSYLYICI